MLDLLNDWATFVRQRHLSDTKITAVGQMSLSDKCPDRRHLSEFGSHMLFISNVSSDKGRCRTNFQLSDICPNRVSSRFHKLGVALV